MVASLALLEFLQLRILLGSSTSLMQTGHRAGIQGSQQSVMRQGTGPLPPTQDGVISRTEFGNSAVQATAEL